MRQKKGEKKQEGLKKELLKMIEYNKTIISLILKFNLCYFIIEFNNL